MIIIIAAAIIAIGIYLMGIAVGKAIAEQDFEQMREEMGLNKKDPWDELFKE